MSTFSITLINVGWGDSIFLESKLDDGNSFYGLIDSNDSVNFRSSQIFIKRHFEILRHDYKSSKPNFDFVMLSHAHNDHAKGLKTLMAAFGTKKFYYPKSAQLGPHAGLLRFANRSSNVIDHECLDTRKIFPTFGDVQIEILWPHHDQMDNNENNNSIVLKLTHGTNIFLLTGDAEELVWHQIGNQIPAQTTFFKVPHHASRNGTFDPSNGSTPWYENCPPNALLGITSHIVPHGHPHQEVLDLLDGDGRNYLRTDQHHHITISSDGNGIKTKYSRV